MVPGPSSFFFNKLVNVLSLYWYISFAEHDAGTASSAYPTIKKTPFSVLKSFLFYFGE